MEFRNLTPFDARAFPGVDTQDREYHVVALCVGYQLRPCHPRAPSDHPLSQHFDAQVIDDHPLALCLADEHWGDPGSTSLRRESDLVPYKPRCDVTVIGKACADRPRTLLHTRLRLVQGQTELINKRLQMTGPLQLVRQGGFGGWMREALNPTQAYSLTLPTAVSEVSLRYELAFGGASVVAHPRAGQPGQPDHVMNEVCYRNPLGAGWMAQGYFEALGRAGQDLPPTLRAPQIMDDQQDFRHLVHSKQAGALDAVQMAQLRYPLAVAGYGPLCKAWAPRLALAGTYDDTWLAQRHPWLPVDFDFAYWNGAPEDQQIPFPDLSRGLTLVTEGLRPGGGRMRVTLSAHRGLTLMRLDNGLVLPSPMQIDLIELDNQEGLRLRLIWRTAVLQSVGVRVLEARFETDPRKPLISLQPSPQYTSPQAGLPRGRAGAGGRHG